MKERLSLLGATGSIGKSVLSLVAQHPDRYEVVALSANTQVKRLLELAQRFTPKLIVISDEASAKAFTAQYTGEATVLCGAAGLIEMATRDDVDTVVSAITGAAGLLPTLAAVSASKKILLANKESLVVAGHLFMQAAQECGAKICPVDSEHNALFQAMPPGYVVGSRPAGVRTIHLTASGGPFRTRPKATFNQIMPQEACAHPNWQMGAKISVDSATMMNKGLEVIEARWLFDMLPEAISVAVHPESIVHSMVEYEDGSFIAQLGMPDMRIPIASALSWPERISTGAERLNLFDIGQLNFFKPDMDKFPCLDLALKALADSQCAVIALNAANEVAVDAFLKEKLCFADIPFVIESTIADTTGDVHSIEAILAIDAEARALAKRHIEKR